MYTVANSASVMWLHGLLLHISGTGTWCYNDMVTSNPERDVCTTPTIKSGRSTSLSPSMVGNMRLLLGDVRSIENEKLAPPTISKNKHTQYQSSNQ